MDFLLRDRSPPRGDRLPLVPEMPPEHPILSNPKPPATEQREPIAYVAAIAKIFSQTLAARTVNYSVPGFVPGQLDPVHLDAKFSDIEA